jgi:hypothetical protein
MGLNRPIKSASDAAHADGTSELHGIHTRQQKVRMASDWEPVEPLVTPEAAKEAFGLNLQALEIQPGMSWIFRDGNLIETPGIEFQRHLNECRKEKSWYWQTRRLKTGKWSSTKRGRKNGVQEMVINLSPAQQYYLKTLPNSEAIQLKVLELACPLLSEFGKQTKAEILGMTIHWDSSKVHFNIYFSRISPNHKLVGPQRLGTAGAWTVGQDRLNRLGVGGDLGNQRLSENLQRFEERKGKGAVPLDVHFHRFLDEKFEQGLSSKQMEVFRECEEFHRKWKRKQREEISQRSGEGLAWKLLHLLMPFLPLPLRQGITAVRSITKVFHLVGEFLALDGPSKQQTNPSINEPKPIQ